MQYYVYQLIDPRNSKPFYVGKGKGERMYAHEREAEGKSHHPKCKVIREIKSLGYVIEYKIIKRFEDEEEAYLYEAQVILNIGLENLTNLMHGGNTKPYKRKNKNNNSYEYRAMVSLLAVILKKTRGNFSHNTMTFAGLQLDVTDTLKIIVTKNLEKLFAKKGIDWVFNEFKKHNVNLYVINQEQPT
jgi:hypothetical protein